MRLLLDTHVLVWWVDKDQRLSPRAQQVIADPDASVHVSVATAWEIAIKVGQSKWPEAEALLSRFDSALLEEQFELVPIIVDDVWAAGLMQSPHRDPFDRLLAAQASARGMTLVTADAKVRALGATTIW